MDMLSKKTVTYSFQPSLDYLPILEHTFIEFTFQLGCIAIARATSQVFVQDIMEQVEIRREPA